MTLYYYFYYYYEHKPCQSIQKKQNKKPCHSVMMVVQSCDRQKHISHSKCHNSVCDNEIVKYQWRHHSFFFFWILLMCVLRTHVKLSSFENIFSKIEKIMTVFSIPKKMFPKTENLMCVLRTHINRTFSLLIRQKIVVKRLKSFFLNVFFLSLLITTCSYLYRHVGKGLSHCQSYYPVCRFLRFK